VRHICTAHHQGDDAEGFLMDLFGMGGGHEGASMLSCVDMPQGKLLRPLLTISRKAIVQVLTSLGAADYFSDPTNDDGVAKRSQMRAWLGQELQRFHPNPPARLAHLAQRRALDAQAIDVASKPLVEIVDSEQVFVRILSDTADAVALRALAQGLRHLVPSKDLRSAPKILQQLLDKAKKDGPENGVALDQKLNSVTLGAKAACFDLPGVWATIAHQGVWLTKRDNRFSV
jgi:tRNA(Ile)-lysidine synthase